MADMTLEELKAKRKEIDEQIKVLQYGSPTVYGRAKLDRDHYASVRPDEWCIKVKRIINETHDKESWYSIIRSADKEIVISSIPAMINDLQGLYEMLKGGRNDESGSGGTDQE